jgi:sporadic carbohydrate cluster protein (TIGR04323 family)|tara:strand:- start:164 stop:577 length:414 start_codon:yes stop_codon:yes gene_type:complete
MKNVRGYNFSRPFMGERVPQHVQNIVIKDFCTKNNLNFLLSATEYSMNNSSYILSELINDLDNMHGIVAYSIFQLPEENKKRKEFLRKILKKKKIIFFACENLKVTNNIEMKAIDTLWKIRKTMQKSKVNEIYKTIK